MNNEARRLAEEKAEYALGPWLDKLPPLFTPESRRELKRNVADALEKFAADVVALAQANERIANASYDLGYAAGQEALRRELSRKEDTDGEGVRNVKK